MLSNKFNNVIAKISVIIIVIVIIIPVIHKGGISL